MVKYTAKKHLSEEKAESGKERKSEKGNRGAEKAEAISKLYAKRPSIPGIKKKGY